MSDTLWRLLQKGPTVLGAQAASPARVLSNQLSQWLLVRRDTGRRGRLRSQDDGAFFARAALSCRVATNQGSKIQRLLITPGLVGCVTTRQPHIGHRTSCVVL